MAWTVMAQSFPPFRVTEVEGEGGEEERRGGAEEVETASCRVGKRNKRKRKRNKRKKRFPRTSTGVWVLPEEYKKIGFVWSSLLDTIFTCSSLLAASWFACCRGWYKKCGFFWRWLLVCFRVLRFHGFHSGYIHTRQSAQGGWYFCTPFPSSFPSQWSISGRICWLDDAEGSDSVSSRTIGLLLVFFLYGFMVSLSAQQLVAATPQTLAAVAGRLHARIHSVSPSGRLGSRISPASERTLMPALRQHPEFIAITSVQHLSSPRQMCPQLRAERSLTRAPCCWPWHSPAV